MIFTLKDKNHKTRIGTALFWGIISLIFIFGKIIPSIVTGILIVVIALLSAFKQINIGTLKQLDDTFTNLKAEQLGLKIFVPSLTIAIIAMIIASFTPLSGTVAIGISSTSALLITFILTKAKPIEFVEDSNRMFQSVGVFAILPQLLASLGALFTVAGVGDIISNIISGVIPQNNPLAGVIAYCLGMAIFTAIMGNGFAAFSVITVGIGVPFVFAQGGDPVICSALALTAGFCGTLLTPMAANFNMLPAALLEIKDKNAVIKAQAPLALILLLVHIILMYTLGF
ncbi:FIG001614: Membrane protein [Clostridium botulinum B str. Eklund 17B (NRP)]|nr:FIG001614: Membrane protein [Clostridium botulinum B str. Eklund 17B (NRP)]